MVSDKKKVYIETSVISNLTSRPSLNIRDAARQLVTHDWWDNQREHFELYSSVLVFAEAMAGDPDAAKRRLEALQMTQNLEITPMMEDLAEKLLTATAVPRTSFEDAVHIACATIYRMDYLLTWNCKHIANAETMPKIFKVCKEAGYECPVLCTPEQLERRNSDE